MGFVECGFCDRIVLWYPLECVLLHLYKNGFPSLFTMTEPGDIEIYFKKLLISVIDYMQHQLE